MATIQVLKSNKGGVKICRDGFLNAYVHIHSARRCIGESNAASGAVYCVG